MKASEFDWDSGDMLVAGDPSAQPMLFGMAQTLCDLRQLRTVTTGGRIA
ncbi:hypothetical protein [Stenotrophomonas sp. MH181796]|nr:hypothetical protein [Stenotrophomonas sp. MH181796]